MRWVMKLTSWRTMSHLLRLGEEEVGEDGGTELERREREAGWRFLRLGFRWYGVEKASMPRGLLRSWSSSRKTWLRRSSTVLLKLKRCFFKEKPMSKIFRSGNISESRASFSGVGRFSSPFSCSSLVMPWSPAPDPPVPSTLKESKDRERLVRSVSPVPDSTSPFHECARLCDSWMLTSSCGLLVPDGSNAALSSFSALSLRVSRVARTSLMEVSFGKSS